MRTDRTDWPVILMLISICICNTANCANHHVWGSIGNQEMFNDWGNAPLSRSESNEFGRVSAQTGVSSFYEFDVFSCTASASVKFDYWGTIGADSRAEIFSPFTGTGFEIYLGNCGLYVPPYGGDWKVEIIDTTTNTPKWISDPYRRDPEGIYEIYPSHSYQLYIYAGTTTQKNNGAQAEVYLNVIPEPASLLLLSLGGLLVRKKRFHR